MELENNKTLLSFLLNTRKVVIVLCYFHHYLIILVNKSAHKLLLTKISQWAISGCDVKPTTEHQQITFHRKPCS